MDAVVDDATCTLDRRFAAQVGNAIFRDDDFDGVFAVIQVGNHRYECADLAFLRRRRSREDGQHGHERVKLAGTADTVILLVPDTWVELMLPNISASKAVLMATRPRRRATSGLLEISCGRSRILSLKKSKFA